MQRFMHVPTVWIGLLLLIMVFGCTDQSIHSPVEPVDSFTAQSGSLQKVPDGYIVVLRDDVRNVPDVASDMARAYGLSIGYTYSTVLNGFSATVPAARYQALQSDARVNYIEPDYIATIFQGPPPGKGPGGGDGGSSSQTTPWGITRVGGPVDGTGKIAWVIDTGIDLNHADLNVDANRSRNFVTRGKNSPADGNGHGTHVAGTIGAKNNTIDVVGVAANATLVAVRVLDNSGSGSYSWVIAGVDYVASAAKSGDVANMSLGGPPSTALDNAVLSAAGKGIKFSIAAGNSSADAGNYSPARVNHVNVYTIASIDSDDRFSSFSNYGMPPVDYAAPGRGILSTKSGGGTTTLSGTSMAAPHVAGLLLVGTVKTDGNATHPPDGSNYPIAHN
jgi:subtilisin family serine protease